MAEACTLLSLLMGLSWYNQQATECPGSGSKSGGNFTSHKPAMKCGQRGWKRHPVGGFTRLGGSPGGTSLNDSALRASGSEVAASNARVYGCNGLSSRRRVSAFSIRLPAYITKIRREKYFTVERS